MRQSTATNPTAVIVGAGIVGAAASYFMSAAGWNVTICEAAAPSSGATGASDGAVSVGTKRPGPLMVLARQARDLYATLDKTGLFAGLYFPRPTYLVARSDEELSLLLQHRSDLEAAGERTEPCDDARLRRLVPGLGRSALGGISVPGDGHAIGYAITDRLLGAARPALMRDTKVHEVLVENGKARGVRTDRGTIAADHVLVAAGLSSCALAMIEEMLIPRKGQLIVTDRATRTGPAIGGHLMSASYIAAKRKAVSDRPHIGLAIDPLVTGQLLIGGTREEGRADTDTDLETVAAILRDGIDLYPPLRERRVVRTFAGVRTASRDGLPLIGRHPTIERLTVATGFEGDGICLGPLMGSIAAQLMMEKPPAADVSFLSPDRARIAA